MIIKRKDRDGDREHGQTRDSRPKNWGYWRLKSGLSRNGRRGLGIMHQWRMTRIGLVWGRKLSNKQGKRSLSSLVTTYIENPVYSTQLYHAKNKQAKPRSSAVPSLEYNNDQQTPQVRTRRLRPRRVLRRPQYVFSNLDCWEVHTIQSAHSGVTMSREEHPAGRRRYYIAKTRQ